MVGLLALTVLLTAALPRLHRALPSTLVAVVVVTVVAGVTGADAPTVGLIPSRLPAPALPGLGAFAGLIGPAMVVAFLAGLESLLSARVADGMTDAPRYDPDRELFGQGLANIASGLAGGLPATGALARTAVNARAGARTRCAALTHALVLAVVVYAASGLVGRIPLVALAGVLMVTAWRMIDRHTVRAVLGSTRRDAAVFAVTAVVTVAFDLVTAVEVGLGLAVVLTLLQLGRAARAVSEPIDVDVITDEDEHALLAEHVLVYRLDGPLFFAVAARFLAEITATSDVQVVVLRLSGMMMLDATGARALGEIVRQLDARHITVLLKGASADHTRLLAAVGTLAPLLERHHVFSALPEALGHAAGHVARAQHRAAGP